MVTAVLPAAKQLPLAPRTPAESVSCVAFTPDSHTQQHGSISLQTLSEEPRDWAFLP